MRGWGPSVVAQMTYCWQGPASHGALADHGGPAGQVGPADHGGPVNHGVPAGPGGSAGTGGLMPITEADFAPSLLYVKYYFIQYLITLFSLVTHIPRCSRLTCIYKRERK